MHLPSENGKLVADRLDIETDDAVPSQASMCVSTSVRTDSVEPSWQSFDQERTRDHRPRLDLGQTALTQVEDRSLIELASRVAVRALDIIGIDFEFRFGENLGAVFQQESVVLHLRISLLRRALDLEATLEHASPALPRYAAHKLAHFGMFCVEGDLTGEIGVAALGHADAVEFNLRAFARDIDLGLDTRIARAIGDDELAEIAPCPNRTLRWASATSPSCWIVTSDMLAPSRTSISSARVSTPSSPTRSISVRVSPALTTIPAMRRAPIAMRASTWRSPGIIGTSRSASAALRSLQRQPSTRRFGNAPAAITAHPSRCRSRISPVRAPAPARRISRCGRQREYGHDQV